MTGPRFLDAPRPVAIAHRGGSLEAEENTMAAFARAVELGYRDIETDVHATRDGVAVIHHDATLERMFGDGRALADLDWAELSRLRTKGGAAVPRVDEFLAAFPGIRVTFELKCDRVADPLADAVLAADAVARICVGSFSPARTARARARLGPDLCWSPAHRGVASLWLAGWGVPGMRPRAPVMQVPPAHQGLRVVTPRFVRAAHARGIAVQVWTVDDAADMTRLLDMGVDGIMTDRPSVLREVLLARGAWHGGR